MPRPAFTSLRTHTFRGRLYRLVWQRPKRDKKLPPGQEYHGECSTEERRIMIHPDKDPLELMFTTVHESFHACFPDLDDHSVDQWEDDTKRLLKRMGIKVVFEPKIKP